jgi:hypothetical protein
VLDQKSGFGNGSHIWRYDTLKSLYLATIRESRDGTLRCDTHEIFVG